MSDIDENQVAPTNEVTPEAPAQVKELSFAEELAAANDKTSDDEPETPVEEVAKPVEPQEEAKPTVPEAEKPEDLVDEQPVETEAERKQRFYEMRKAGKEERQELERSISQQYQPQPADELTRQFTEQGYTEFEAEMLARDEVRNQRDQINSERTQVAELNMQINTEAVQVMHDYPVFDPKSSDYDKDFAKRASDMYNRAAGVKVDPRTGAVISTNLTPYNFYKELAEMRGSGVSQAQVSAQRAAEQQMASVAPPSSTAPVITASKEDAEASRMSAAYDRV